MCLCAFVRACLYVYMYVFKSMRFVWVILRVWWAAKEGSKGER